MCDSPYDKWHCTIRPDNLFIGVRVSSKTGMTEVVKKNLGSDEDRVRRIKSGEGYKCGSSSSSSSSFVDRKDLNMICYNKLFGSRVLVGLGDDNNLKRQRSDDNDEQGKKAKKHKSNEKEAGQIPNELQVVQAIKDHVGIPGGGSSSNRPTGATTSSSNNNNNNDDDDIMYISDTDEQIGESNNNSKKKSSDSQTSFKISELLSWDNNTYYREIVKKYVQKYGETYRGLVRAIFANLVYVPESEIENMNKRLWIYNGVDSKTISKQFINDMMLELSPVRVLSNRKKSIEREYNFSPRSYINVVNAILDVISKDVKFDTDMLLISVQCGFVSILSRHAGDQYQRHFIDLLRGAVPRDVSGYETISDDMLRIISRLERSSEDTRTVISELSHMEDEEDDYDLEMRQHRNQFQSAAYSRELGEAIDMIRVDGVGQANRINENLFSDKNLIRAIVEKISPEQYDSLPDKLKANIRIATKVVKQDPKMYAKILPRFVSMKGITTEAVKRDGLLLRYADKTIKSDYGIAKIAVQNNPEAIKYVDESIRESISRDVLNGNGNKETSKSKARATTSGSTVNNNNSSGFFFTPPIKVENEKSANKPTTTTTNGISITPARNSSKNNNNNNNNNNNTTASTAMSTFSFGRKVDENAEKQVANKASKDYSLPERIVRAIMNTVADKALYLNELDIDDAMLLRIINYVKSNYGNNIKEINLADNKIGNDGLSYIIRNFPEIKILNLNNNRITYDGVIENLTGKKYITIDLRLNNFSEDETDSISKFAIKNSLTILAI